ncbi:MAG: hypothetical protein PF481_02340 [Bacteroidales bacterium]|jgi:hypothetical protein|nr:hypothetical protein [Bacteroidales bacterium]
MRNSKTIYSKLLTVALLIVGFAFLQSCDEDDVVTVVKTELEAKITEADNLIATTDEGTANGQYTTGSQATLQAVIDVAQTVYDSEIATQTEVDNSIVALDAAIVAYDEALVTPIAPESLIAHWGFDEGNGTTVADFSDNGFDGTFGNEPLFGDGVATWTTDRYGNEGGAIAFDLGAKVTIPYSAAINPAQLTIALWVNAAEVLENNRFMGMHSWNGFKFQLQASNKPFFTASAADGIYDRDSDPALDINKWYHLAVTFGEGEMAFYVNGVNTITHTEVTGDLVTVSGHDLVFGVGSSQYAATADNYENDLIIPAAWGGYYNGSLDEIRMYNTVLSATQISGIYNLEKVTE